MSLVEKTIDCQYQIIGNKKNLEDIVKSKKHNHYSVKNLLAYIYKDLKVMVTKLEMLHCLIFTLKNNT